jgi:hypothetical protein
VDTRRSYYLACRQDDFAEAPRDNSQRRPLPREGAGCCAVDCERLSQLERAFGFQPAESLPLASLGDCRRFNRARGCSCVTFGASGSRRSLSGDSPG